MPETDKMCHDLTRIELEAEEGALSRPHATKCARHGGLSMSQGRRWRDTSKRRRGRISRPWSSSSAWWKAVLCLVLSWTSPAAAALLNFDNCLSETILDSNPPQLQYIPLNVSVHFNFTDPLHPLNVTVYGNVSGTADGSTAPSWTDPSWSNSSSTVGKIVDVSTSNNRYSTLLPSFDVLSFTAWNNASRFCDSVTQGECPLGPVFTYNL